MSEEIGKNLLMIAGGIEGTKMVLDGLITSITKEYDDDEIKKELLKEIEKHVKHSLEDIEKARDYILVLLKIKTNNTN